MSKTIETMTVSEAIAAGYDQCVEDGGCTARSFDDVAEYLGWKGRTYWILDAEPTHYQICDRTIKDLIKDHVLDQSEVADEDGALYDCVDEIPVEAFAAITKIVNDKLAERNWWPSTNIQLVADPEAE